MRKASACWVPCVLTHEEKQTRVNCCRKLVKKMSNNILTEMMTVDENWAHHYEPDCITVSTKWKPTYTTLRAQKSAAKVKLPGCWNTKIVLLKHGLPHGNTVNGQHNALLTKLRNTMQIS